MLYLQSVADKIWLQEFKAQCFGGDYTGEVYDHVLKKSVEQSLDNIQLAPSLPSLPPPTHTNTRKQNSLSEAKAMVECLPSLL